jgi:hypothetical protein
MKSQLSTLLLPINRILTQKGLMIVSDNATRWNSTYLMIHRALKLRHQITLICIMNMKDLKEDILSEDKWDQLKEIEAILMPFYKVTKRLEGNSQEGHHGLI